MPMLKSGDISISYDVDGEHGATVILVHAFPVSRAMWRPQVEVLKQGRVVVSYDCRGFGQSDAPSEEGAYSQENSVHDLSAVLRATSPSGAILCGLSMGGNIALQLALERREKIKGLILASTGAGSDNPEQFRERVRAWADLAEKQGMPSFAEMIMQVPVFAEYADRGQTERRWMYDAITENRAHGVAHTARRVLGGRPTIYEWEEDLRRLTMPTLIMAGERDEACCKMAAYMARTIPGAESTILPEVGHFMNLESSSEFNALVARFADKLGAATDAPRPR